MKKFLIKSFIALLFFSALFISVAFINKPNGDDWGFFGHRRINRMAVFTLPKELIVFYKKHIEYITEHAVDPDKRRYATRHEAVRHYIDIDHWGTYPFTEVPRNWTDALVKYTDLFVVTSDMDTLQILGNEVTLRKDNVLKLGGPDVYKLTGVNEIQLPYIFYKNFFEKNLRDQYYEDDWLVNCDSLQGLFEEYPFVISCTNAFAIDRFSEYGILPYHLVVMQNRLTKAFRIKDIETILRLSSEFGHYIGDAHVPLHTTENYNGQLTNQVGIHAFWESRIPELFADKTYNFFVGKADYIENISDYYWDVVLTSHSYLDSVLAIEKRLSLTYPEDKQYCYEERLGRTIRTQCQDYAAAYQEAMKGMVERRMRESIQTIGSAWYTAWIDAGQPDLQELGLKETSETFKKQQEELDKQYSEGKIKGRTHEN